MVLLVSSSPVISGNSADNQLTVAVATNFVTTFAQLARDFTELSGLEIRTSTGSTGKLYTQILNGMDVDVFLSGDQDRVTLLIENDLAKEESRITYALGRLAFWMPDREFGDGDHSSTQSLLQDTSVLAIANPKLAPYGLAANQSIDRCFNLDRSKTTIVNGENIGQTFAFVSTRNADAGFVALSSLYAASTIDSREYQIVSSECHDPIRQDAVILKSSRSPGHAQTFLNHLRSAKIREFIETAGYSLP